MDGRVFATIIYQVYMAMYVPTLADIISAARPLMVTLGLCVRLDTLLLLDEGG